MNRKSLNYHQTIIFLNSLYKKQTKDDIMDSIINDAKCWDIELNVLNYNVCTYLASNNNFININLLYQQCEEMNLLLDEFGSDFAEYLLRYESNVYGSLKERLDTVFEHYIERKY